jgi:hypothetical protein
VRESTLKAPEDEAGVVVGAQLVLARSDTAAVVLHVLLGYPEGIAVELGLHLREAVPGRRLASDVRDEQQPERFRLGFGFGEPTDPLPLSAPLGSGRELTWYEQMASGSDRSYVSRLWVSPYPPSGTLAVSAAWEERGIPRTDTRLAVPTSEAVAMRTLRIWE